MTYKFVINGAFGSKTVSFRSREKRDLICSLIASHGNFSKFYGEINYRRAELCGMSELGS